MNTAHERLTRTTFSLPLGEVAADALALIDRFGGQVDLVGHDWGGMITYTVCGAAPSQVRRAVTLAIPHPATLLRSLAYSKQWKKSWYMALFQLPGAGLPRAPPRARPDRSPVARLVAELHARLRAP